MLTCRDGGWCRRRPERQGIGWPEWGFLRQFLLSAADANEAGLLQMVPEPPESRRPPQACDATESL
ncbi:hypothetical protein GCM10019016_105180 [Streptomyces prasinosporus]|uniref:Transposase n=1 Tax=Streptomyces prasinosporus TaxID=68256 RepID=A0ABP6U9J6_9ACTN